MRESSPRRNPWGTLFLVAAAVGTVAVHWQPWWPADATRLFRAFFEASLVGALADWFAVTALFKRPLGLPLPHTDLLVRKKDQLVEALPRFLGSFLVPERLNPVLLSVDWSALVLEERTAEALDELAAEGLHSLWTASARPEWEQKAITVAADLFHRELSLHKDALVGPITDMIKRHVGWRGLFVQRQSIDEAVDGFLEELRAVRDRPNHAMRRSLATAFHQSWPRLVEQLKPSRWSAATRKRLELDPAFRQQFNQRVGELAVSVWQRSAASTVLTNALSYVLSQTDARGLADRIEGAVRNDLQYIRVNGALVGGLAGLALELLKTLG